jgi:hypothetical protein
METGLPGKVKINYKHLSDTVCDGFDIDEASCNLCVACRLIPPSNLLSTTKSNYEVNHHNSP